MWGALLLEGGTAQSLPSGAQREQGLVAKSQPPGKIGTTVRSQPWRRLRERVMVPLGYLRKLLHPTDGLDMLTWVLMVSLVLMCPFTKVSFLLLLLCS